MTEPLALKYRPKTFDDLIGQNVNASVLKQMVAADILPSGMLFTGPRGCGKTSSARIIANSLNSDMMEIDAASHGLVDDVRELLDFVKYTPASGQYRLTVLDEAHNMSKEAFNALLKTLEEPPERNIFILVTTEPSRIPETVKSRLMEFTFRKVTPALISERLMHVAQVEGVPHNNELISYISTRADGSVRDALMLLDQCRIAGIDSVEKLLEMSGDKDVAPELLWHMTEGNSSAVFDTLDKALQVMPDPASLESAIARVFKDILILQSGGVSVSVGSGDGLEIRKRLAKILEPERIVAAMKMIWDLKTRVKQSSDPRANLDLAIVLIMSVFTAGRQIVTPLKPEPERKLTLDEL